MGASTKTLPAINKEIMKNGPKLTHEQQLSLIAEVIEDEEIVQAVQEFFITARMYKCINCTTITLVPKVNSPTTAREFRPIACCTVLYKIISKILSSRLQGVITSVISEAQAGFIPGRKISDNIILSHELVKAYTRKNSSPRCMIKIDLTKAYDSVEWIFLEQVMVELGFPSKFQQWVLTAMGANLGNQSGQPHGTNTRNGLQRMQQGNQVRQEYSGWYMQKQFMRYGTREIIGYLKSKAGKLKS
ncbi:uncharacterized protein [Nicotiana sylvestris]|uniref:Uncharacterized protein LOC104224993 n=1 Tax=Nicotiana sylvestris TaxID=4096 RepID=A0A1U7WK42_NICSY|nr:PREDICTED: uncharacterized protein LOC104224993 [Nicotiana sylvestris]